MYMHILGNAVKSRRSRGGLVGEPGGRGRDRSVFPCPSGCLGNDRCGNRRRFVPRKGVSARSPLGTKGSAPVLFAGAAQAGSPNARVDLLAQLHYHAGVVIGGVSKDVILVVTR